MNNQIEITTEMEKSLKVEGDDNHKVFTFKGVNGDYIRIYDESRNMDSQVVEIEISKDGYGHTNNGLPKTLQMAAADFDFMCEKMHRPLRNKAAK